MQPFNKYYPPDWTPDKGSVNKHVGKHPLGDRARKLDQGILIVRFELPFNIWCTGCDNHIGKGVRYNAEKKKIGKYYSTPILQFRMKCHLCSNWIEIHTDPKNTEYKVVSGAKKKVEEWEPEDTEVIKLKDEETKERLELDPIFRLEHGVKDKAVQEEQAPVLTQLQQLQQSQWSDPYTRSQQLRRTFREQKKKDKALQEEADRIRNKHSLHIPLLPESPADLLQAKLVEYTDPTVVTKRKLEKSTAALFPTKAKRKNLDHGNKSNGNSAVEELGLRAKLQTRLKTDPFLQPNTGIVRKPEELKETLLIRPSRKKHQGDTGISGETSSSTKQGKVEEQPLSQRGLVSYVSSDSNEEEDSE